MKIKLGQIFIYKNRYCLLVSISNKNKYYIEFEKKIYINSEIIDDNIFIYENKKFEWDKFFHTLPKNPENIKLLNILEKFEFENILNNLQNLDWSNNINGGLQGKQITSLLVETYNNINNYYGGNF